MERTGHLFLAWAVDTVVAEFPGTTHSRRRYVACGATEIFDFVSPGVTLKGSLSKYDKNYANMV